MFEPHYKIDVRDEQGESPLEKVVKGLHDNEGCLEVAHYLLSCGCDSDEETLTELLFKACRRGKLDIVRELVEHHKLDPNSEPKNYVRRILL